jgi:hypothetical protein
MIKDTNHLQKLIEDRVNEQIKLFANDISNQILKFAEDNGGDVRDRFYEVRDWHDGKPISYGAINISRYKFELECVISKLVKDKMIEKDVKFLLDKMNSLIK